MSNIVYLQDSDSDYVVHPMKEPISQLPAGVYRPDLSPEGYYYSPITWVSDDMFFFSPGPAVDAIGEINGFWKNKHKFTERGFIAKRSILLYGAPGTGKTCAIHQIVNAAIERDTVVFFYEGHMRPLISFVRAFRKNEPERNLMVVLEDIDRFRDDESLLMLLDGQYQADNVITLTTTNHVDRLPDRLINRPGRIDRAIHVDMPNLGNRTEYLESLLKDDAMAAIWAADTEGLSLAHLRELVVSVDCLGQNFDDVLLRLKDRITTSQETNPRDGFDIGSVAQTLAWRQ